VVNVYNATGGWPVEYPYVLASYKYATLKVRNACYRVVDGHFDRGLMIVDSGIGDKTITNEMILKRAIEVRADFVVPKDYLNDVNKTVESLHKFEGTAFMYGTPDTIWPLQWPYEECLQKLCLKNKHIHFALGGLVGLDVDAQLERIKAGVRLFKSHGGRDVHLFGIYPRDKILRYIRENNEVIASLDTNVPEIMATNGKIIDIHQLESPVSVKLGGQTTGKHTTRMRYILARYNLEMLQLIVNHPDIGQKIQNSRGGAPVYTKFPKKQASKTIFDGCFK